MSDSLDDPFIFGLIKAFGGDGYLTFFGILEIYSREFRTEPGWKLTVTESYLKQKLYKRQGTVILKCLKYIRNLSIGFTNPRCTSKTIIQLKADSPGEAWEKFQWDISKSNGYALFMRVER